jgi:hypothetical protein
VGVYYQQVVVLVLRLHLHELVFIDRLADNTQPFVRLAEVLNRHNQELRVVGKARQLFGNHLGSLPSQYVNLNMLKGNKLLLALLE